MQHDTKRVPMKEYELDEAGVTYWACKSEANFAVAPRGDFTTPDEHEPRQVGMNGEFLSAMATHGLFMG